MIRSSTREDTNSLALQDLSLARVVIEVSLLGVSSEPDYGHSLKTQKYKSGIPAPVMDMLC